MPLLTVTRGCPFMARYSLVLIVQFARFVLCIRFYSHRYCFPGQQRGRRSKAFLPSSLGECCIVALAKRLEEGLCARRRPSVSRA